MNKVVCIISLFVLLHSQLKAQKIVPAPEDIYSEATEFMQSGDYKDALFDLLNLQERGYATANVRYLTAECYLNIPGQKTKAIAYLKEAAEKASSSYKGLNLKEEYAPVKTYLYLGIAYRLNNDFESAIKNFEQYILHTDDVDKENKRLAEFHIEKCNYARDLMASPSKYTIDTLPPIINTSLSNFNPLTTRDEKTIFYNDELKFYDAIRKSVFIDNNWTEPDNLTPLIQSDGDHFVTGISADGSELFLTGYDPYRAGEIFAAHWQNEKWSIIQKLNENINTIFNESHASLSPDGKTLYFTSDRKGGYGGMDIYKSERDSGNNWSKALNLGPLINTPYNEETPFVSSDGRKLFFSSQGHYNMGGYDIMIATLDKDGGWLPPVNIGYPLNTADDDLFFFPVDTGEIAYQSRYSRETGNSDIVRFKIISIGHPVRYMINGKMDIKADEGFNPSSVNVFIIDHNKDTLTDKSLNEDGSFRQKLSAGRYTFGFKKRNEILLLREMDIPEYFPHNNLVFNDQLLIPASVIIPDTIFVRDVRFDFNKSVLLQEWTSELEKVAGWMMKYPGLKLLVNGYTDALGSEEYNQRLSLIRAGIVKDYLVERIGNASRINIEGKGEQIPLAKNRNSDGSDNPTGRSFNRRAALIFTEIPASLIVVKVNEVPENLRLK